MVKYTKNRLKYFSNIYKIHTDNCNEETMYPKNENDLKSFGDNKLFIKSYVLTNNIRAQYIELSTGDLLPVYPIAVQANLPIKLLTEIEFNDKLVDLWNKYKIIDLKLDNKFYYSK